MFDPKKFSKELLFLPLGGSGEIGMNFNLYYLDGKWLIIDMGVGFAGDDLPGIDMMIPSSSFLDKIKKDIAGIVITHAHEDHLGAVQYMWNDIEAPVYTTTFNANFLRAKTAEFGLDKKIPITEIDVSGKFSVGPFNLELLNLTHSVPEMSAIMIRTKFGNILHTGDWKFDDNPLVGAKTDHDKLARFGKEGVKAIVCDSTNIFSKGHSGSEGELRKSMIKLIGDCKEGVVVTTFASNVARVETIAKAANAAGRQIAVAGRSLHRIIAVAKESGYLKGLKFISDRDARKLGKREYVLMSTGCQGEARAATAKIANKAHPQISLSEGDTVIFSSKIIPGNDKKIYELFNKFIKMGVEVLTERDHFVHCSGHPYRDEIIRMYETVKPEIAIPVHGEHIHIHEHANLAKELGVPQTVQIENGKVLKLSGKKAEIISEVDVGYLGIDGNFLLSPHSEAIRTRRKIGHSGLIVANIILGKKGELKDRPSIMAPGILGENEDIDLLEEMENELYKELKHSLKSLSNLSSSNKKKRGADIFSDTPISNLTRSVINKISRDLMGKKVPIFVNIIRV